MGWTETLRSLFEAGGWVMYPLAALSVLSVALTVERALFWTATNSRGRAKMIRRLTNEMRRADLSAATSAIGADRSVYGRYASALLNHARGSKDGAGTGKVDGSFALERAEALRPVIERFATVQSTIIAAAPMLGILGTVTGIIESFRILNADQVVTDPAAVAGGIAEALLTTAFGLIVALVTMFPHAVFRAQSEKCLTRLELIAAPMIEG